MCIRTGFTCPEVSIVWINKRGQGKTLSRVDVVSNPNFERDYFPMKKYKCLCLILTALMYSGSILAQTLCPDGTYVGGSSCSMAPDGSYVGGDPQLAPDGSYVGGEPTLAPDGSYVGGDPELTPDGSYVGGEPLLAPDGSYVGDD